MVRTQRARHEHHDQREPPNDRLVHLHLPARDGRSVARERLPDCYGAQTC
jgi:hypothetical protein